MNLFYSCVTSVGVVGAVWTLAFMQPQQAVAGAIDSEKLVEQVEVLAAETKQNEPLQVVEAVDKSKAKNTSIFDGIEIVGNTQSATLSDLNSLMEAFNNNASINAKLYQTPSKVYIFYRNFSANFDTATITVGYNSSELIGKSTGVKLPAERFDNILPKGNHTGAESLQAWQDIDYGKNPQAVIEVHYLNKDGMTAQSELFVSYEQGA